MASISQDNQHYYTKYQEQGQGNIALFCRQEQINYDNFIHYCTRQKRKREDLLLAPVVLGRSKKSEYEKGLLLDVRIHYPNGVSVQISSIAFAALDQLIRLGR